MVVMALKRAIGKSEKFFNLRFQHALAAITMTCQTQFAQLRMRTYYIHSPILASSSAKSHLYAMAHR